MKFTNNSNLPLPIADILKKDFYNYIPKEKEYSATELINAPKLTILRRRHREELSTDVSDMFFSVWGNLAHEWIQNFSEKESLKEERLSMKIGDYTITGKFDLYFDKILYDLKLTSVWTYIYGSRIAEWTQQLNIYASLLKFAGFSVESLKIIAMFRDWQNSRKKRGHNYPNKAEIIDIELWDNETTLDWIAQRLQSLTIAEKLGDDSIVPCSKKDRWQSDTIYAVMKKGRKSSVKNCEKREEADALVLEKGTNHFVEVRQGSCVRCLDYCEVSEFCNFYKNLNK